MKITKTQRIFDSLKQGFPNAEIEIFDESEQHRGHAGYMEGGESHFRLQIRAMEFVGKSRIARHRLVHSVIGKELLLEIHALSLDLEEMN